MTGIITNKELKAIQQKLKPFKGNYMDTLVGKMNDAAKTNASIADKTFDKQAIYNIFNGVTKSQVVRMIFLRKAKDLLQEFEQELAEARSN